MCSPEDKQSEIRSRLLEDPHYPQYHFLPSANWMNDPNGLIQWKGQYHLFYQHNPNGAFWGTMHWGHAVSNDLVHWNHLPIALVPEPGGSDKDGCFSGCAIDNGGTPTLVYTGVFPERPCLATSTDDLLTWEKYGGNPVISSPPKDLSVVGFRDHSIWREGDTWCQVIGSGIKDVGGTALLYKSLDLIHWQYVNPILIGDKNQTDPLPTGTMWECPDFFAIDHRQVLVVSALHAEESKPLHTMYFMGTYANDKFTPEVVRKLDFGDTYFYAPQTFLDDNGRRVMLGWIKEGRSEETQRAAGWSGVMSLPRVISLGHDNLLGIEPAPELRTLRGRRHRLTDVSIMPTSSGLLDGIRGDCLEIAAEFEPGDTKEFGIKVRCSPGGEEQTLVTYDRVNKHLVVDGRRASLSSDVFHEVHEAPFDTGPGGTLNIRVFLDRSVLEVFANGWLAIAARVYPSRRDSLGLDVFARGGDVNLRCLDIWEMNSVWKRE